MSYRLALGDGLLRDVQRRPPPIVPTVILGVERHTTLTRLTRFDPSDHIGFAGQDVIEIGLIGLWRYPPDPLPDTCAFSVVW